MKQLSVVVTCLTVLVLSGCSLGKKGTRADADAGSAATMAPFRAPAEVPTTRSGRTPAACNASSMPTWTEPKAPAPDSTNASGRGHSANGTSGPVSDEDAWKSMTGRGRREQEMNDDGSPSEPHRMLE